MKNIYLLIPVLILMSCATPAQKGNTMDELYLLDKNDFNPYVEFYSTDIKDFFNPEQSNKYPSTNLFDGYLKTCWVAGSSKKNNKSALFIKIPDQIPVDQLILNIFSGYGKNKALYLKNSRPKKIKISLLAAFYPEGCSTEVANLYIINKYPETKQIYLVDTFGVQSFHLEIDKKAFAEFQTNSLNMCNSFKGEDFEKLKSDKDSASFSPTLILKLEIEDVYRGSKYDDICISEIFFNDRFVTAYPDKFISVDTVYIKDDNTLMAGLAGEKDVVIIKDTSSVYTSVYHPAHSNWAILSYVPNDEVGEGSRIEERYSLIDLKNRKKIDDEEFKKCTGHYPYSPLIEKDENGRSLLELFDDFTVVLK